jgi:tol-pal system protein YbgF
MMLRRMARGLGGRSVRAAGLAIALAALAWGAPAHAQSSALSQEVERLKADLKDLQRYVYGSGSAGSTTGDVAVSSGATGGDARVAQFEVRITALEDQIRQLQGQIEEIGYNQRNLQERLDRLVADVDARLAALERGGGQAGTLGAGTGDAAASTGTGETGGAVTLIPPDEGETATATGDQVLPPGSAMDQYNYAFSLLKKADYDDAETALSAFVAAYPQDPLTGNALYWLGETYYVRADYNRSAVTFLRGYRDFPDGTKAADNLLKLGMSLAKLDKKVEACATFSELGKKFPDASEQIRSRAKSEAATLGCS